MHALAHGAHASQDGDSSRTLPMFDASQHGPAMATAVYTIGTDEGMDTESNETHTAAPETVPGAEHGPEYIAAGGVATDALQRSPHMPSRYATTEYNRYVRLMSQIRDLYGTVEHFRLSFREYLARKDARILSTHDWRKLPRVERARLDGYMQARYERIANGMVWILHYAAHTGTMCEGTVTVQYEAGFAFDRGDDWSIKTEPGQYPVPAPGTTGGISTVDGHRIPWIYVDGGIHCWPARPEDVQKYRLGLMSEFEVWKPWSDPEDWSTR